MTASESEGAAAARVACGETLDMDEAVGEFTHPPVRSFDTVPRFDQDRIRRLITVLSDDWDDSQAVHAMRRQGALRRGVLAGPVSLTACAILLLASNFVLPDAAQLGPLANIIGVAIGVTFFGGVLFTFGLRLSVDWAIMRYLRRSLTAIVLLRQEYHFWTLFRALSTNMPPVTGTNYAGRAARALFHGLQGSRLSWRFPPAVADWAADSTRPLIGIDLSRMLNQGPLMRDKIACEYSRFLHDAAALVVVERVELIPKLVNVYSSIPWRLDDGDKSERDLLYLDPMRTRGRWEVVKDYVLPLAAWIGVAVSLFIGLRGR